MTNEERKALETIEHSVVSGARVVPSSSGLSGNARRVVISLASRVNRGSGPFPSLGHIADDDLRRRVIRIVGLMRGV